MHIRNLGGNLGYTWYLFIITTFQIFHTELNWIQSIHCDFCENTSYAAFGCKKLVLEIKRDLEIFGSLLSQMDLQLDLTTYILLPYIMYNHGFMD